MILGLAFFFFLLSCIRFLIYTLHTRFNILPYIKIGVGSLTIVLSLLIFIPGWRAENFWEGMFLWISSPWLDAFPMVGWSRNLLTYPGHQNTLVSLGYIFLYGLTSYVVIRSIKKHSGYYYEDVLEATKSNGVLIFGILPTLGLGFTAYVVSHQFVYALSVISIGMCLVTAVMLNLSLDIIRRLELKELG